MEWRNEILRGISVLPRIGIPGRINVFGKSAEPILTGHSEEDVLVASAEYGKGRIVAIAHSGYDSKFMENGNSTIDAMAKFHSNLKQWLTRGTYETGDEMILAKGNVSVEKLASSKIVISEGEFCNISLSDMTEYVRNGGALLHCITPWAWPQWNEGKNLSDVPYIDLLCEAGIYYTDEYISAGEDGFPVEENKAEDAHLLRVLEEVERNLDKAVEKACMLKRLKHLPKRTILQLTSKPEVIWKNCNDAIKRAPPTATQPFTNLKDGCILDLWLVLYDILESSNTKAPGVEFFPGDFSAPPPLTSNTVEVHSDREDFHSTGCYLPAGRTLKVEVLSGNDNKNWQIMIGCHSDDLTGQNHLRRWTKVSRKIRLDQNIHELSTPFGGLIYLISPETPKLSITVKLENVVDAPRFVLTEGEKGKETWNKSRNSSGLWADIVGKFVTITVPASSAKDLEFDALTSVMKTWDSVARLFHDLRGTDATKFRRSWFVPDEQPSAGSLHSGYPIVSQISYADPHAEEFLLNGSLLLEIGNWGPFHEIGHNLQRGEWTFDGMHEVTANIFSLCGMETISHAMPWTNRWVQGNLNEAQQFFKDGADYKTWKSSSGFPLIVYAQLSRDFGWDSYRKVFRRYEAMPDSEKPRGDPKIRDTWFTVFSETVGFNLAPLATFWNIPLSSEAVEQLKSAFPVAFLPDDEVTRFAPNRIAEVLQKFPGTVRKT